MPLQYDYQTTGIAKRIAHGRWEGKTATVMGLGRFGGGVAVAQWLAKHGMKVIVSDRESTAALQRSVAELQHLVEDGSVELHLGSHKHADFDTCDLVVANPAIPEPWQNKFLQTARDAGVPITTEIELVTQLIDRDRTIAITGSAGKSTTSAMTHHLLRDSALPTHLAGNIGGSLLNTIDQVRPSDFIVLELSSAMLHWLSRGDEPWSPRIAVITNIEPNHINWHGSFEHYRESKLNIIRHQRGADVDSAIVFESLGNELEAFDTSRIITLPDENPEEIPLAIPGVHNQQNAMLATAAARELLMRHEIVANFPDDALQSFTSMPHRLQYLGRSHDIKFYNDSKSTTPAATQLAVEAFAESADRIHLIVGGSNKGADWQPIAAVAHRVKSILAIGQTGQAIIDSMPSDVAANSARYVGTIDAAIETAMSAASAGDIILLSPGCASFDQFANYEERGRCFEQLFRSMTAMK